MGRGEGIWTVPQRSSPTQEQLELIANWVDGGAPEGDPNDLPAPPKVSQFPAVVDSSLRTGGKRSVKIQFPFQLDGFWPKAIPESPSAQITVELPGGRVEPLVWLRGYKTQFAHAFFANPAESPAGFSHSRCAARIKPCAPACSF